ncbi:endonuclease III [bacterium]|nr:endonuclease III [bacterium]
MRDSDIDAVVARLEAMAAQWKTPIVTEMAEARRDPFRVLIATVLSLRTKDETTALASARLFALADTPAAMLGLSRERIAEVIYPVGFYRTKAENILELCRILLDQYEGQAPSEMEALLALPGVGRKTANLVLSLGHGLPGLCVDTHVHRISNRLGYVHTRTPEKTEFALREKLPLRYWTAWNDLLVAFGQNLCKPVSPFCSRCTLFELCARAGVIHSR